MPVRNQPQSGTNTTLIIVGVLLFVLLVVIVGASHRRTATAEHESDDLVKDRRAKIIQACIPILPQCQSFDPGTQPSTQSFYPIKPKGAILVADVRDRPAEHRWMDYSIGMEGDLKVPGAYIVSTKDKNIDKSRAKGNEPEITVLLITNTVRVEQSDVLVEVCGVYWPELTPARRAIVRCHEDKYIAVGPGYSSNPSEPGAWPKEWGGVEWWAH